MPAYRNIKDHIMSDPFLIEGTLSYVNQRDQSRNRPPNLNIDCNGEKVYVTIPDAAVPMCLPFKGQWVQVACYENSRGYVIGTAINDQQMPSDQRGRPPAARQGPSRQGPPQVQARPATPSNSAAYKAWLKNVRMAGNTQVSIEDQASAKATVAAARLHAITALAVALIESGKDVDELNKWADAVAARLSGKASDHLEAARRYQEKMKEQEARKKEEEQARHQADDVPFDDEVPF